MFELYLSNPLGRSPANCEFSHEFMRFWPNFYRFIRMPYGHQELKCIDNSLPVYSINNYLLSLTCQTLSLRVEAMVLHN